jgi:hypothetical protein
MDDRSLNGVVQCTTLDQDDLRDWAHLFDPELRRALQAEGDRVPVGFMTTMCINDKPGCPRGGHRGTETDVGEVRAMLLLTSWNNSVPDGEPYDEDFQMHPVQLQVFMCNFEGAVQALWDDLAYTNKAHLHFATEAALVTSFSGRRSRRSSNR